ncbi:MAG: hypothetical protein AB7F89_14215, partial [Pirellulaceae bacterium]
MPDKFLPLKFPFRGVDVSQETLTQPPDTSPVGQNVRAYDAGQDRRRGGSRAGISRFIDDQVSGENLIQFLGTIVTTTDEAMGWAFEGRDFGFTGVYGSIGFITGISGAGGEIEVNGGGGYQSNLSYNKPKFHLELEASAAIESVGAAATITARFKDESGDPPDWEPDERRVVELRTTPTGSDGDLVQAGTNFAGVATFNVANASVEDVVYRGKDITKRKDSTNSASIEWQSGNVWTLAENGTGDTGPFSVAIGVTVQLVANVSPGQTLDYRRF